jgi:hypothetical protein
MKKTDSLQNKINLLMLGCAAFGSLALNAQSFSGPVGINSYQPLPAKTSLDIISPALPQTPQNYEIMLKGRVSDAANDYFNIQQWGIRR